MSEPSRLVALRRLVAEGRLPLPPRPAEFEAVLEDASAAPSSRLVERWRPAARWRPGRTRGGRPGFEAVLLLEGLDHDVACQRALTRFGLAGLGFGVAAKEQPRSAENEARPLERRIEEQR